MSEPKYKVGDIVRVSSLKTVDIRGAVREMIEDSGDWFYTIDDRNYLHEAMLELAPPAVTWFQAHEAAWRRSER